MADQDQEVVETNEVEEPEVQDEEVQEPSQEEPSTEEPEGEALEEPAAEEPERPQSRREALRIAKLAERRAQQIVKEQAPSNVLDYSKALEAEPEVVAQLEADRKNYGQQIADQTLRQVENVQWNTRLEIDAPRIEAKYPQLDKGSDQFDPIVADALNQHYLNLVGFDPQTGAVQNSNLRYADFIEAQFELAGALATEKVARTSENIAKQAATTGLRPGGNSAKRLNLNQAPEAMSDEELDAAIAQTLPRDNKGRFTTK